MNGHPEQSATEDWATPRQKPTPYAAEAVAPPSGETLGMILRQLASDLVKRSDLAMEQAKTHALGALDGDEEEARLARRYQATAEAFSDVIPMIDAALAGISQSRIDTRKSTAINRHAFTL